MDSSALTAQLSELFDQELLFHGFTSYMRDYELVVYESVDPHSGLSPRHRRYLFRFCTEVDVSSAVRPDVWARSLSDELLQTHNVTRESSGYVWGVNCQVLYPGASLEESSERAKKWEERLGIPFHEVRVEGNAQIITLIFSDLLVESVAAGYAPYTVTHGGVAERYAEGSKHPLSPRDP